MLVLKRKSGERIMIGKDIVITLIDLRGKTAKIGIEAPKDLGIYREELYNEIKKDIEAKINSEGME